MNSATKNDFLNNPSSKITKIIFLVLFSLILCGCASLIRVEQASVQDWASLSEATTVGQTFVAKYDGLLGVLFYLSPETTGNGQITLHLRASPQSTDDLAVSISTLTIEEVNAPGYYPFSLPVQKSSNQKYYYAFMEITGSGSIQVGTAPGDTYLNGSLYKNRKPEEAQSAFKLSYSRRQSVLGLIREMSASGVILLAGIFLFILPGWGLLSLLWPRWEGLRWPEKMGLSSGLSLAIYPLFFLWTDLFNLHLGAYYAWLPPLAGLGMILWCNRKQFKVPKLHLFQPSKIHLADIVFVGILILIVITRFWAIRSLEGPQWGDSVQHTEITQLFLLNGGLFKSWLPYAAYRSFTVQYGFSAFSAVLAWLTGMASDKANLIFGQINNILAVLTLYPLAVRIAKGNRWAGTGAVLVAGLISPMPAFYVNWGRFAQLAGQTVLPVALWFICEVLFPTSSTRANQKTNVREIEAAIGFSALTLTGMLLSYYRMSIYYITFILSLLVGWGLPTWRLHWRLWIRKLVMLLVVGVTGGLLFLPWAFRLIDSKLVGYVELGMVKGVPANLVLSEFRQWQGIFTFIPRGLMALTLVGLVWSLVRKYWVVAVQGLWVVLLTAVIAGKLIHLPFANMMTTFAIQIALYIPASLVVGWIIAEIAGKENQRLRQFLSAILLSMVAIMGAIGQRSIVNPAVFAYVTRPDTIAMKWIQENLPSDVRFLVEGAIYNEKSVIGSDAGWWIPLLANRENTMPPQYAIYNEIPIQSNYNQRLFDLVKGLSSISLDSPEAISLLCSEDVTHVYIGQGQGNVAFRFIGLPQLFSPNALLNSQYYRLLYQQDRVYVFALQAGICP